MEDESQVQGPESQVEEPAADSSALPSTSGDSAAAVPAPEPEAAPAAPAKPSPVIAALAKHLKAQGIEEHEAEARRVLAHLVDLARHSMRFNEATVRAVMALTSD